MHIYYNYFYEKDEDCEEIPNDYCNPDTGDDWGSIIFSIFSFILLIPLVLFCGVFLYVQCLDCCLQKNKDEEEARIEKSKKKKMLRRAARN